MKEFISAVEDIAEDEAREARIQALMAEGKTREEAEEQEERGVPIEFMLDGRVMHAYQPTDGQLAFMMASMGRGQSDDGRFASIINVMLECFRDDDKDHFEQRLLTSGKDRIKVKKIEEIFEFLIEEWFARPTQ